MRETIVKASMASALIIMLAAPCALARGGGSAESGPGMGGRESGQERPMGPEGEKRMRESVRPHMRASETQRTRFSTSKESGRNIRVMAREMSEAANGPGFTAARSRETAARIKSEIRRMNEEHHQFMQTLSEEQREGLKGPLGEIKRLQYRVNSLMDRVEQEIAKDNPAPDRIAKHAREMEEAMFQWQKAYRRMGTDMGIQ